MRYFCFLAGFLFLFCSVLFTVKTNAQEKKEMGEPVNKPNVIESTPSISLDGRILIFVSNRDGMEKIYQSRLLPNGNWGEPTSIDSINMLARKDDKMGSSSLSFDGNTLFFCATFDNSIGDMDIYYSERNGEIWSKPKNIGKPINTELWDGTPSIASDGKTLFFARENPGFKTKGYACKKIFVSYKDSLGNWQEPIALPPPINLDCEQSPRICSDNRTLFFSSVRPGCMGHADLFMVKMLAKNIWSDAIPLTFASTTEGDQYASVTASGERLFYSISGIDEKSDKRFGGIYYIDMPAEFQPYHSATIYGTVIDSVTRKPLEATFIVRNANTSEIINIVKSNKGDGNYILVLNEGRNYAIEIMKENYSHQYINYELKEMKRNLVQERNILLFSQVDLQINVFDKETYRPLNADIEIKDFNTGNLLFKAEKTNMNGRYIAALPISQKYKINVSVPNYKPSGFDFDLDQILQFSNFSNNIELEAEKEEFVLDILDETSGNLIDPEIYITEVATGETKKYPVTKNQKGQVVVNLNKNTKYEINISAKGYSFYNTSIDLDTATTKVISAKLTPLVTNAKLTLKDINFETNSAELQTTSFEELDRVVKLMTDNPDIKIEISAHTDNVGSDAYNMKLSDRRAASVVNYLKEKNVQQLRLVFKGYGESQPVVPNDTDENKARNRRVELKIM